jgi:hypothetical protein
MAVHAARPVRAVPLLAGIVGLAGTFASGCGGDKSDSGGDDPYGEELPGGGEGTPECGGEAPVITQIQCSSPGVREYEQGEEHPTLKLSIFVEDADADLSYMEVEIYYDKEIDGAVSTQDPNFAPLIVNLSDDVCDEPSATNNIDIAINGTDPQWNLPYEWGVVVRDANDMASAMFIVECITPFENGDEGNGEG